MNKYKFHVDRKVTVWERDEFLVEASTKEEAIQIVKKEFEEAGDAFYVEGETHTLYDTQEFVRAKEDQAATLEIYYTVTNELIANNWEDM